MRKVTIHEAGVSLSYHGRSHIGKLVRASKYEGAGPFPGELVLRAVEAIQLYYPIESIDSVVSVPPSKSGEPVETFAQSVANMLHLPYRKPSAKAPLH